MWGAIKSIDGWEIYYVTLKLTPQVPEVRLTFNTLWPPSKQEIYTEINQNLKISEQCCWSFWSSGMWNCITGWAVPCVAKIHSVLTFSVKQVVFCDCGALWMKDYSHLKCRELGIHWHGFILEKTGIFDKSFRCLSRYVFSTCVCKMLLCILINIYI